MRLKQALPQYNHVVIVSDADEILRPLALHTLRGMYSNLRNGNYRGVVHLEMDFFYYNFQWLKPFAWINAFAMTGELFEGITATELLRHRNVEVQPAFQLNNAGWHLSYFMDPEEMARKLNSFSHQEYNRARFRAREWIDLCVSHGVDLLNRTSEGLVPSGISTFEQLVALPPREYVRSRSGVPSRRASSN